MKLFKPALAGLLYIKESYHGFREVHLGESPLRVLPYDRKFWDSVDVGQWEPETLQLYESVISPGMQYCDIGAWIGPTVLYARHCGARVTCFEPDPLAYERLLGNLRLNGALDVRTFQIALGESDSTRTMGALVGSLGKSATSLLGASAQQKVNVTGLTWKTAQTLLGLPVFQFIKIDIEGGEVELLPTMFDYLREFRPVVLLSTHWHFLSDSGRSSLLDSLAALGQLYPGSVALGKNEPYAIDFSDPLTPSRQSQYFLKP